MLHDYIERKMDDFAGTLAQVAELKNQARWLESAEIVGKSLRRLLGTNYGEFVKLTEIGILAGLVKNGPTVWVPYKMIMVIALLKEAGDIATVQYPPQGGHGWYLKALHLLLDALAYDELRQYSELVPNVEVLLSALADSSLPVRTRLLLMREYERRGDFR